MKRVITALLTAMLLCVLPACQAEEAGSTEALSTVQTEQTAPPTEGHVHTWQSENCEQGIFCGACGTSEGAPNGHIWESATCVKPEQCELCGKVLGNALGHHYENDTCLRCGEVRKIRMPVYGIILREYCADALCYNPTTDDWRIHPGIDIAAAIGTSVHAVTDGVVERAYDDVQKGLVVIISHPGEYVTTYCGLLHIDVSAGDTVSSGQIIGAVGNTNLLENADDAHLHFEVMHKGVHVDPKSYVNENESCRHEWLDATCEKAERCSVCGETKGAPLGHSYVDGICSRCGKPENKPVEHIWKDATCTEPKTCKVCGLTEGKSKGHNWQEATCTAPKTCKACGVTEGKGKEHNWQEATCTEPKTCKVCGLTEGKSKGHNWQEATCTTPKTCSYCQLTDGAAKDHIWLPVTCHLMECQSCGATKAVEDGHNWKYETCTTMCCYNCGEIKKVDGEHQWVEATCQSPRCCLWCGQIDGNSEALGQHQWKAATCTAPKTCTYCGIAEGAPAGHVIQTIPSVAATCTKGGLTEGKRCSVCNLMVQEQAKTASLGHNWIPATYTAPKTCSRCGLTSGSVAEKRPIKIEKPDLPHLSVSGEYQVQLCNYTVTDNMDGTYHVEIQFYYTNLAPVTVVGGVWCTLSGLEPYHGTPIQLKPLQSGWCTVIFKNVPGGEYEIMLYY